MMMQYDQHNYSGVGVNPMYGTAGQSTQVAPDTSYEPLSPPSSTQPSEYDVIINGPNTNATTRTGHYVSAPPQVERRITSNSLYASHNAALLRHPTLSAYESTKSTDLIFDEEVETESHYTCMCSLDLALAVGALLVIILSVMAITLALLLQFGVTTPSSNSPSVTTITVNNNNNTSTNSSAAPINSSSPPSLSNQTEECDCSQFSVSTTQLLGNNFTDIENSLLRIMDGIERMRANKNISVNERVQLLSDFLSQIKSINDSLQQLRPQANQPRHPILTGLNYTANITVNHNDCTEFKQRCNLGSAGINTPGACQTTRVEYITDTHVVVATSGTVTSSQALINATSVAMQVQPQSGENFFSNETVLERLKKGDIYYLCTNFNRFQIFCDAYFRRCSYQMNLNVTASISFH